MSSEEKQRPTTDMDTDDWHDVAESEFVDITKSPIQGKTGFVFDHPEIGLHGFEYNPETHHIRACSFEVTSDGE